MFKTGVTASISKGVSGRDGPFLKPAVAYIDTLGVFLVFQVTVSVAESIGTGVILIAFAPCVGQFPAGADRTGKNIHQSIAALGAALSEEDHRVYGNLVQNAQIHNAAAVEDQNQLLVVLPQEPQTFSFYIGQKIIALLNSAILSLARLPGENINSGVCFLRQFIRQNRRTGRVRHGMLPDIAEHLHGLKNTVFLNIRFQSAAPCSDILLIFFLKTIHPEGSGERKAGAFQPFLNSHAVPLPYIAAAASTFDGHAAAGAIEGDFLRFQRQYTVIFQQHNALCRRLPC